MFVLLFIFFFFTSRFMNIPYLRLHEHNASYLDQRFSKILCVGDPIYHATYLKIIFNVDNGEPRTPAALFFFIPETERNYYC
jgi:hypothetical protein